MQFGRRARSCFRVCIDAHAALWIPRRLVKVFSTVGCAAWGAGEWLGVVQQVLLARWRLGARGDAGCDAGSVGAPGAPLWCFGAFYRCRRTWVCAVLGGCRRGIAGCCVLCFLFCTCVPLLTVCMLCRSYLSSGFFCATPDAYSVLCLVLHCAAPLDVSQSHKHNPVDVTQTQSLQSLGMLRLGRTENANACAFANGQGH